MKSICIVIYRLNVGGAEQVVVEEIREFLRRGYAVRLITLNPERTHSLMSLVPSNCKKDMIEFHYPFAWRASSERRGPTLSLRKCGSQIPSVASVPGGLARMIT